MRSIVYLFGCCAVLLFHGPDGLLCAAAEERPNIVLLMGDDHGWDETAYNGHPHLRTPVLNQMAAEGLRLDRFYAAAPVCSPTRGSVITGRHPNRYGTFSANYSIRPDETSIAQLLSDAGYGCGHFGKWHLGPVKVDSPTNPGAMGFEEWLSHDNFFEMNPLLSHLGEPPKQWNGEGSEIVVQQAIRFVDQVVMSDRPFFLVIWFGSPHEPYSGLKPDLALYNDLPQEYADRDVRLTSMETGRPTTRPLRDVLQERYAEITAMDRAIGTLRSHLAQQGLGDNTLVWYCGDNGIPGGERVATPFRGAKGSVYEGGVRVPGVIEFPRLVSQPRVSDVNTVTSDILPTLCDLVGITLPDRPLDGISLKPLLDGGMRERPSPICFWTFRRRNQSEADAYIDAQLQQGTTPLVKMMNGQYTRTFVNYHHREVSEEDYLGPRAILSNRYKLVIHEQNGAAPLTELFDVRQDPAEEVNLLPERPDVSKQLREELRSWQQSVLKSLTGEDYH